MRFKAREQLRKLSIRTGPCTVAIAAGNNADSSIMQHFGDPRAARLGLPRKDGQHDSTYRQNAGMVCRLSAERGW
jgi:hypothetical protein